ncbi:MAG: ABC transporter permease [Brevinemataceae bacterium]
MKLLKKLYRILPVSSYLALRRIFPYSRMPGSSLLPGLAFASITVGVAASVLILSLANGLHSNYLDRLAEKDSHITIFGPSKGIPAYETLLTDLNSIPGIIQVYPYSQNEALIKYYDDTAGIILKSYPSYVTTDPVFNKLFRLVSGTWSFGSSRNIVIGEALAKNLGILPGDHIDILVYDNILGSVTYRLKISGIFTASDAAIDASLGFLDFSDAAEIFDFENYAPYIGIRVKDYLNPEKYFSAISQITPFKYTTWIASNINTLLALQNEKQVIRVLLFIFFCVAFFGILAVMTALVENKRDETALLKALGMTPRKNFESFMLTGLYLGLSASLIGAILGIILSLQFNNIINLIETVINFLLTYSMKLIGQELEYRFTFLNQSVYYLNKFPILINTWDIIFSCSLAILCTLTAAIYPARISKNYRPAEILRKQA